MNGGLLNEYKFDNGEIERTNISRSYSIYNTHRFKIRIVGRFQREFVKINIILVGVYTYTGCHTKKITYQEICSRWRFEPRTTSVWSNIEVK